MTHPTYLTSCPSCGAGLSPHAGHPDACPWQCFGCHRGWWVAELSPAARTAWDHATASHGYEARAIRDACHVERQAARERGTSALPEQIGTLSRDELVGLGRRNLRADFAALATKAQKAQS